MLTTTPLNCMGKSRSGAAIIEYLQKTEYYRDKDGHVQSASTWLGRGAEALGLQGEVDAKLMEKLASGFGPDDKPLCQNAGKQPTWEPRLDADGNPKLDKNGQEVGRWVGGKDIGVDLTFSAPKSLSIAYAAASPDEREQLLDAHHRAVGQALGWIESQCETRRGKGGRDHIGVDGLVISRHTHFGSRELDPQIHSHCLVYSVCKGEDGQWATMDNRQLIDMRKVGGALYRAELARNLQELGYGIEQDRPRDANDKLTGEVYFKMAGVSDEVCDAYSKRHHQIVAHLAEHGGSSREAALRTRKNKDEPTYAELTETWTASLAAMREQQRDWFKDMSRLKEQPDKKWDLQPDSNMLDKLHEHNAVLSKHDIIERVALEHVGHYSIDQVLERADALMGSDRMHAIAPQRDPEKLRTNRPARKHREERYSADWMVQKEYDIAERAVARKDDASCRVSQATVDASVAKYEKEKGFQLSGEQREAVQHIACGTGGVACLTGRAGTGKTATAEAWISAFHAEGWSVIGTATSQAATKKLEAEAHIPSYNTAELLLRLDGGQMKLDPKTVIVFDEAGMASTHEVGELQKHIGRVGGKLVLQGDENQLQPVGAGAPMRLLTEKLGRAELKDIRRQKGAYDRETATLMSTEAAKDTRNRQETNALGKQIYGRMEQAGQVEMHDDSTQAMEAIAKQYIASPTPVDDKLVLAGRNSDVAFLNKTIRGALQEQGTLAPENHNIQTRVNGRWQQIDVSEGERIRFTKRNESDKSRTMVNGQSARVDKMTRRQDGSYDIQGKTISDIPSLHNRSVRFNSADYPDFTHDYAMTVHKAQGQGKKEVWQLADAGMSDQHLSYVGFTRQKEKYRLVGGVDDLERIASKFGLERLGANATQEGVMQRQDKQHVPEREESRNPRKPRGIER